MSGLLDGRDHAALADELRRRAAAVFGAHNQPFETGQLVAIVDIAARIGEEVTGRLDRVPEKQAANFYAAMGQGRDPPRPASLPVAIALADTAPRGIDAPSGTRLQAPGPDGPVSFETLEHMSLVRGSVAWIGAVDLAADMILAAPATVIAASLPRSEPVERRLVSGAAARDRAVQIAPAAGLAPGACLSIGDDEAEHDHDVVKIEGDLVTLDPPLDRTLPALSEVREVSSFDPFGGRARNRQSHTIYLGHPTLLDLPSAARLMVSGLGDLPGTVEWRWFGKQQDSDPEPGWHEFAGSKPEGQGRLVLDKPRGKPEKTAVGGRNAMWIRAALKGRSTEAVAAGPIAILAGGCEGDERNQAEFQAVAVITPVVPAKPFHPFGLEPRLYDSFHIGCNEAFARAGARVTLDFTLGGPVLGNLAPVAGSQSQQVFSVGTDGLLYRARLDQPDPGFKPVPMPVSSGDPGIPPQAAVAARLEVDGNIRLVMAGKGRLHTTRFTETAVLQADVVGWTELALPPDFVERAVRTVFIGGATPNTTYALLGHPEGKPSEPLQLVSWGDEKLASSKPVVDFIPVQNAPDTALELTRTADPDKWRVAVVGPRSAPGGSPFAEVTASEMPAALRVAWRESGTAFVVAGFGEAKADAKGDAPRSLSIVRIEENRGIAANTLDDTRSFPLLPLTLSEPVPGELNWPVVSLALSRPVHLVPRPGAWIEIGELADISATDNRARSFVGVGKWIAVHHPDRGLLVREHDAAHIAGRQVAGSFRLAVRADQPMNTAEFAMLKTESAGGYWVQAHTPTGDWLLEPIGNATSPPIATGGAAPEVLLPLKPGGPAAAVTVDAGLITLTADPSDPADGNIRIAVTEAATRKVTLWNLARATPERWTDPGLPTGLLTYVPLAVPGGAAGIPLTADTTQAYLLGKASELRKQEISGQLYPLRSTAAPIAARLVMDDGEKAYVPFDHGLWSIDADGVGTARFAVAAGAWQPLGPNQPANPDLSWEYWNGSAWVPLDREFVDPTADLQVSGKVIFTVPHNMAETDVGGQKNRWIRARLIGGDYGEALVTIANDTSDDKVTKQTVSRDITAIRAPHIISLILTYCSDEPFLPEFVLAEDNLAFIDQSGANRAGLPVRYFVPVSELFPGWKPARAPVGGDADCCDRWEAPHAGTPPAPADPPANRMVLICLAQPPAGDAVSIHVDAEPQRDGEPQLAGATSELDALVSRDGGFSDVEISDATHRFTEPGAIRLRLPEAPDRVGLFGQGGYWVVFGGDEADWKPRIRGIHLNGTRAASVESRRNESIGSSSGAPGQIFNLSAWPVDPESLRLWIAEPLGSREIEKLGAEPMIEGIPGPWLPWRRVDAFPHGVADPPERLFTLDALTGSLRFGNGRNAMIPPPGSALIARSYRRVAGAVANGIKHGDRLEPVSPIGGVERIVALDDASGGADTETPAQALARAPAKLRHGDRLVTLEDVAEFVRARMPEVAQARVGFRRGKVRLAVTACGADPRPLPATLRGVRELVASAATYGIAGGDRLEVLSPRLLPIRVEVEFEAIEGVDAATDRARLRDALVALFDHASGGLDGMGWPLGVRPEADQIAAALVKLENAPPLASIRIVRVAGDAPMPDPLPGDVLVRLAEADAIVNDLEPAE